MKCNYTAMIVYKFWEGGAEEVKPTSVEIDPPIAWCEISKYKE